MAVQNTLVKRDNKPATFSNFLTGEGIKRKINEIVGGKDGQLFITGITSAVSTNPALAECDNSTILSAALLGASLKLSPSPQLGQYYIVPFNDRKNNRKVATFQLGYKGYVQLAIRSGMYHKLNVLPIKDGELVSFDPLNEEIFVNLIEDESTREQTATIGYYAMFEYTNGFKKAMYWSTTKMMLHADKFSPAFSAEKYLEIQEGKVAKSDMWKYSSFWYKNFDDMACKTMLRQLIGKWGVMSIELQQAIQSDEAMIKEDLTSEYIEASGNEITTNIQEPAEPVETEEPVQPTDPTVEFFGGNE